MSCLGREGQNKLLRVGNARGEGTEMPLVKVNALGSNVAL